MSVLVGCVADVIPKPTADMLHNEKGTLACPFLLHHLFIQACETGVFDDEVVFYAVLRAFAP